MKIRIQGSKEQCLGGIKRLQKNTGILKISDFVPIRNSQIGVIYVEVKD